MRSNRRKSRTALVAPVILAMSASVYGGDDGSSATPQAQGSAQAAPATSPAPSAQKAPYVPGTYRSVPYRPTKAMASTQTTAPAVSGTPQTNGAGAASGQGIGAGGILGVPSPYESTANPGANSPAAPPSSGGGAGGGGAGGAPSAADLNSPNSGAFNGPGGPGGALASGLGGNTSVPRGAFTMIGDQAPPVSMVHAAAFVSPPATPGKGPTGTPSVLERSQIAPSVRGFKIAENQSPLPQDRIFFGLNYFDNVNRQLNKVFQAPIHGVDIYRYTFGFEKTFNGGLGSVGLRLPLDNVFARSNNPSLLAGGNATALGNLTIFAKHIFYIDQETGSVASGGIAISPMTAPSTFGGAKFLAKSNTTAIQPFFAFLINRDRLYFQGFTAIDVPVDPSQPTLIYNDFGLGYYVYRDNTYKGLITAVAPTLELHLNNPINHSGAYNPLDKNGTPDIVNITSGLNTRLRQSSILTMGVVVPVTGPRPFSIEATVLFNYYFGRSRPNPAPPIIGN